MLFNQLAPTLRLHATHLAIRTFMRFLYPGKRFHLEKIPPWWQFIPGRTTADRTRRALEVRQSPTRSEGVMTVRHSVRQEHAKCWT